MITDADDEAETAEAGPKRDDDEGLLARLKRWEREARNHASDWREEARLCYDFVAGHQWASDDKRALIDQMRQPVTFNRTGPMVDAVIGAEILNRQEVQYAPREQGDVAVNELITAADTWARDLADTEDEESDAFADTVICGMGWTETRMDYSEDAEGRIIDDRVDALEMWWDPQARKRNLADRRYHIRGRWREKADLPKKWLAKLPGTTEAGNHSVDDMQTGWTGPMDDYEREDARAKEPADADKKRVWIRHFQWFELEPAWRIADPFKGEVTTVTKAELKEIGAMFIAQGMRPPKAVQIEVKRYYEAFLAGNVILDGKQPIEANQFTLHCITGKRDRNSNTWYGVVRSMLDPQRWGNKFFVQILHIINTAAKGGLMYERGALANPRKALEDWGKPDAAIELERGALVNGAVQEREAKNYPQGLDRLLQITFDSLPQVSGVNLEMLGLVERDQPGVLEAQRKKAGYAILAVFFDSLRRYRKMKGRTRLYFIQNYISDGRLIRIKGKDSTMRYVPLMKDRSLGTYDVIVDEAPMSPNQKEMVWQMMLGLMPMLTKLDVPPEVWTLMLEYSPLPSSVSSKINEIIGKAAEQPPPPDPKMVELQAKMQMDQQKNALDAAMAQQNLAQDQEKHAMAMAALEAKTQATVITAQIQQHSAEQKAALEMQKAAFMATLPKPQPSGKAA